MNERGNEQQPVLLVIDDSPDVHRLLAVKLRDEDLELLAAFGGDEGCDLARSHRPALILLDLNMPGIDGWEVLRSLKADTATMPIPVIMLSGMTSSDDKVRAFGLGAMDYVTKPFDVPELKARVQSAIRLTRLMKLLEQRAQIDGLTGLWNRKFFNERLASELNNAERSGGGLSLVMCDLDHFKKLNDTFGHPAGDAVLQSFAGILSKQLRSYDVACRYGGEEFSVILPADDAYAAVTVCDRIRTELQAKSWAKWPEMRATGSFGVADVDSTDSREPSAWIEASDNALYAAKANGRNRVYVMRDGGAVPAGVACPHQVAPALTVEPDAAPTPRRRAS